MTREGSICVHLVVASGRVHVRDGVPEWHGRELVRLGGASLRPGLVPGLFRGVR